MKNRILMLSLAVFAIGVMTTNCTMSAPTAESNKSKIEDAKKKVVVANQELNQQLKDSIQLFRNDSEQRIANYEKQIADLKLKNKKKANSDYEKVVAELEQQNKELRKKLAAFNDSNQKNWASFKTEFNHDLDKIGKAFKDITVNNEK